MSGSIHVFPGQSYGKLCPNNYFRVLNNLNLKLEKSFIFYNFIILIIIIIIIIKLNYFTEKTRVEVFHGLRASHGTRANARSSSDGGRRRQKGYDWRRHVDLRWWRGTGDGRGDGGVVLGESLVLRTAGICYLGAAPCGGACGPGLHDEGNALPQAVDVGATELMAVVYAGLYILPSIF